MPRGDKDRAGIRVPMKHNASLPTVFIQRQDVHEEKTRHFPYKYRALRKRGKKEKKNKGEKQEEKKPENIKKQRRAESKKKTRGITERKTEKKGTHRGREYWVSRCAVAIPSRSFISRAISSKVSFLLPFFSF